MGEIYNRQAAFTRQKVAAYARVSLETDRLSHSLSAQTRYYRGLIRSRADWELAGIYADSFISGTETSRRTEFQRLLTDCESGKIDIVLCKSISRFARNTVDLLRSVRRLKDLGVEVRFEKENINSLSSEGELMLTLLASFAQEESRSISENVKWGIRKHFRAGDAEMRNKSVLGYRYGRGHYVIVPEEAEIVRLIFADYVGGVSLRRISEHLRESGLKTHRVFDFSHSQINYIVHNEIYIGNIVLQKTFVKDFMTHAKVPNRGELPLYRFENRHEPIIDRETFSEAQRESERRAAKKSVYPFTRRLICAKCGKPFTRRSNGGKYACWHCRNCENVKLKEDKLSALLGMTDEEFSEQIANVTVRENGSLEAKFYDGRNETWQYE